MPKGLFEVAIAGHLVADKLAAIRSHAEECASGTKVSNPSVMLLAKYQVRVCDALMGFLASLDATDEDYTNDIAKLVYAARQLARMTRFFAVSEGPLFQSDVLLPWANTVRSIEPDADVIVRAQSAYEFEGRLEIREMLAKLLPLEISRANVFRGFPRYFLVLNIPTVEGWNLLHHTLIAHEVGHFIFKSRQLEKVSWGVVMDRNAEIEKAFDDWKTVTPSPTPEKFHEQWSAIISSRFKELMSDIFAAQIVGPCVLPALRDFGLPGYTLDFTVRDGQMFYYPSFRKRFATLLKRTSPFWSGEFRLVKKAEDQEILDAVIRDVRQWDHDLTTNMPVKSRSLVLIDEIVDSCVEEALRRIGEDRPWEYRPTVFRDEIFELYNRIQDEIPPNELVIGRSAEGTPAAWQSVLNAAWLHYSYSSRDNLDVFRFGQDDLSEATVTQRYRKLHRFNDFMTRSLEMAIVHRQFLEQKALLGDILDDAVGDGDS